MPAHDPTYELNEILNQVEDGFLPQSAQDWAASALETAQSILETVERMQNHGMDAPTPNQDKALANIYMAACEWLHQVP